MAREVWKHWVEHSGPDRSFQISLPPSWTSRNHEGSMIIEPGTGAGYLTLRCQSVADIGGLPDKKSVLQLMFPARRNLREVPTPPGEYWRWGLGGEADLKRPPRWWKRLFRHKQWQPWMMWLATEKDRLCLATYLRKGEQDFEEEELVRFALGTLQFLMPRIQEPEEFLKRASALVAERFPRKSIKMLPPFGLVIEGAIVDLQQAWKEYQLTPEQLEAILWSRLWPVLKGSELPYQPHELTWDALQSRIMPMLCHEAQGLKHRNQLFTTEWVAGLQVTYVLDEPHSYRYIHRDLFRTWNITQEQLHQRAIENLEQYFQKIPMEFAISENSDAARLLLPVRADAYNSSRILSEAFQQRLREELGTQFVVGVPSRDFFVAISMNSPGTLDWMRRRITDDFQQLDHPLCNRLLLVSSDGVSELTDFPDPESL